MSRILLIVTSLFAGGAEKQYRYIMESLQKENEVSVLMVNKPLKGLEASTVDFINKHPDIHFVQLKGDALNKEKSGKIRKYISKVGSLIIQYFWIKKNIKEKSVDVVMYSYVTQLLMTPLFKKKKIGIIFNERNTGRQICNQKYKIKLLSNCDKLICNSQMASEYITRKTGMKVEVINNGIEMRKITKRLHDGFVILVPARVNEIKNQLIVVQALIKLKELLSDDVYSTIKCYFAGTIEDEKYASTMQSIINQNCLQAEFLGYQKNIEEIYKITDLLILPSFEEGTPNVLLESYMFGISRLISDIPTNRICALDSNYLFNPDDSSELASKICNIVVKGCIDGGIQSELDFLEKNYSIINMRNNYQRLIKELT